MRQVRLLLGKDLRVLARAPAVLVALIVYPLVVAVIVGLVVRYAGDRPRVALVDEDGLPAILEVGGQRFDVQRIFDRAAEDVELVRLTPEEAQRQLDTGRVLGIVVIPKGFQREIRGMIETPQVVLRTTESALANRIVEKVQALVYAVNLELQQAYIKANLEYVNLLLTGGHGSFAGDEFDVMGLEEAERRLDELARAEDPRTAEEARALATFVRQAQIGLHNTDEALKATANPIKLAQERGGGRALVLSVQVQAYALALTLGFIAVLLAAAGIAAERDENVIGRLTRGLVRLAGLVVEKVAFVALVAGAIGLILAVGFGLVVELGGVTGGQPWVRLPLLAAGLLLAGASFGALGVLVGTLAREARAATLVAFLVALPIVLIGLVPAAVVPAAGWVSDAFPFVHAVRFLTASLSDGNPAVAVVREAAWLAALGAVFGAAARLSVRRLLA